MKTFEYKTYTCVNLILGMSHIRVLGSEGWEACGMQHQQGNDYRTIILFKREIEEIETASLEGN